LLSRVDLEAKVGEAKAQMGTINQPYVRHDLNADVIDYHKAILKITYELAWLWLGETYLDDPVAIRLRRKILENSDEEIHSFIQIGTLAPFDKMWADEPDALLALGQTSGGAIVISVRIFDVLSGYAVVSYESARYPSLIEGRFFCCDPQTRKTRDTTLSEEVSRIVRLRMATRPFSRRPPLIPS
jgi:hypothetical protein